MTLTAAAVLALITNPACGNVAPDSELARHLVATAQAESQNDPLAIGVNADPVRGLPAAKVTSDSAAAAAAKATALLAQGRRVDLGLFQISDRQLPRHHLSVAAAFDPCANVAAGAQHLADDHAWVLTHRLYNCGRTDCGVTYAQRVTANIHEVETTEAPANTGGTRCDVPAWDTWAREDCSTDKGDDSK